MLSVNCREAKYNIITKNTVNITINNQCIEQTDSIKYLGIFIDKNLKWTPHVKVLNTTLAESAEIISRPFLI